MCVLFTLNNIFVFNKLNYLIVTWIEKLLEFVWERFETITRFFWNYIMWKVWRINWNAILLSLNTSDIVILSTSPSHMGMPLPFIFEHAFTISYLPLKREFYNR